MLGITRNMARKNPELRPLLATNEIQEIFQKMDSRSLEARAPLAAERETLLAGKHAKAIASAAEKSRAASRKCEELRLALQAARAEEATAFQITYGTELGALQEIRELERKLIKSCDPRAEEFYDCVDVLHDQIRLEIRIEVADSKWVSRNVGWTKYQNNLGEVNAAIECLAAARQEACDMRFLAISRAEITSRLRGWSAKLAPLLAPFGKKPPIVTDTEVEAGQSWWPDKTIAPLTIPRASV